MTLIGSRMPSTDDLTDPRLSVILANAKLYSVRVLVVGLR